MSRRRKRIGIALLSAALAAFFVVKTVRWVNSGCPVGFACGSCASELTGRRVVASSDHLLTKLDLHAMKTSTSIDIEGRHVEVAGDQVVIDKATKITIPSACKVIEFVARGEVLTVLADGKRVREMGR
jgi:hypothetical protein